MRDWGGNALGFAFCDGNVVDLRAVFVNVQAVFDLTPYGIIEMLDLIRPIYRQTAAYGHFGRELPDFTWEKTDRAAALKG